MKLLDPFAGYRLASGHPFFHIALFAGSYCVQAFGSDLWDSSPSIIEAFDMLRWSHFILFSLAMIESYCNMPSKIKSDDAQLDSERGSQSAADQTKETLKMYHRDGSWKLIARVLSSFSVFVYQGSVFNAQMVLYDDIFVCDAEDVCYFSGIHGNRTTWLVIETICFYIYVLATVFYIIWRQCAGLFDSDVLGKTDMNKALQDFISYAAINLTWFAINFVLVVIPPILIFLLNSADLTLPGATGSYLPIMYTLWGMHTCHFIL